VGEKPSPEKPDKKTGGEGKLTARRAFYHLHAGRSHIGKIMRGNEELCCFLLERTKYAKWKRGGKT